MLYLSKGSGHAWLDHRNMVGIRDMRLRRSPRPGKGIGPEPTCKDPDLGVPLWHPTTNFDPSTRIQAPNKTEQYTFRAGAPSAVAPCCVFLFFFSLLTLVVSSLFFFLAWLEAYQFYWSFQEQVFDFVNFLYQFPIFNFIDFFSDIIFLL